ncbi:rhodanese-like domain-containing protein [Dongia sp.]|uniref:rhodanese-like domain-containing protein n=1 Tax=Dongia sp. TaxID=1977262 RepID=UPI0035B12803
MVESGSIQIGVAALQDLIATGRTIELVDVREPWEVDICRIVGSRAIPLGELQHYAPQLRAEVPLIMICHHGMRSLNATMWLRRNGFDNAMNLAGGIDAWAREIDPDMARY